MVRHPIMLILSLQVLIHLTSFRFAVTSELKHCESDSLREGRTDSLGICTQGAIQHAGQCVSLPTDFFVHAFSALMVRSGN
jgi:hypothetical protein